MTPVYKLSANSVKNGRTVYGSMLAGNPVYVVPGDFQSIATVTVGSGGATSAEFTSIPGTYAHLQIRALTGSSNAGTGMRIEFNSDTTTANYRNHYLYGGSVAGAGTDGNLNAIGVQGDGATVGMAGHIIDILDYTNTNKYTTVRSLSAYDANVTGLVWFQSTLWMNTAAITNIKINRNTSGFNQYSHFALYGIKGA